MKTKGPVEIRAHSQILMVLKSLSWNSLVGGEELIIFQANILGRNGWISPDVPFSPTSTTTVLNFSQVHSCPTKDCISKLPWSQSMTHCMNGFQHYMSVPAKFTDVVWGQQGHIKSTTKMAAPKTRNWVLTQAISRCWANTCASRDKPIFCTFTHLAQSLAQGFNLHSN